MTMYTVHAYWDLRWSSRIPAFASELSSSLANVKGDLFLSPAVLCIGKLSKNVEVLAIGQAAIGRGRGYTTDTDKWHRSGVCVSNATFHSHSPQHDSESHILIDQQTWSCFFARAFY